MKTIFYTEYLFLILFFSSYVVANVVTFIDVPDSPPYLAQQIPNQTLLISTPKMDAFNLNDYFKDDNGDNISFSFLEADNMTITISENGSVSFIPDLDYLGVSTTVFYATDSSDTIPSNVVYIFVSHDTEAPKWSNPKLNRQKIFQNSFVNFSAKWTDNFELASFVLSLDQGDSWVNSSAGLFSGRENTSIQREQISAEPGSTVYWRIYASDTSGNWNVTDIQSLQIQSIDETSDEATGNAVVENQEELSTSDLSVDPAYFTISLKQGSSITKVLKVKNVGTSVIFVNLSQRNLDSFLLFSQGLTSFQLSPGDTKEILLEFSADEYTIPEQYLGDIIISGATKTIQVPVILDVNLFDQQFGINISLPKKIKSGVPFKTVITITNLKDVRESSANVAYAIKDFDGNVLDFNESLVFLNDSVSFNASLKLPSEFTEGRFIYYVRASNNRTYSIASEIFQVGTSFDLAAFLKLNFTLIIILIASILIAILAVRYKRYKDREKTLSLYLMLNELKNFIREDKLDSALEVYIRIKNMYNEPISKEVLKDKELLKEELKSLAGKLKEKENVLPKEESKKVEKAEGSSDKKEASPEKKEESKEK